MKKRNKNKTAIVVILCMFLAIGAGCGIPGQKEGDSDDSILGSLDNLGGQQGDGADGQQGEENDSEKILMPDFEMTFLDGGTASFEEYRGKKVLLNFWATWCGPCVGEMPAFQKLADEYPEELVILAVNCSEAQSTVQKFNQSKGYTFPIILDADGAIQAIFGGVTSLPLTVIIDEEGYIVTASEGAADADTMYGLYKEALGL